MQISRKAVASVFVGLFALAMIGGYYSRQIHAEDPSAASKGKSSDTLATPKANGQPGKASAEAKPKTTATGDGGKAVKAMPGSEVAAAVLDDCDPNYEGPGPHGDGIRLVAADGGEVHVRKGLNNCETISANHGVVLDPKRRHVYFRELAADRVTGMDFTGKTLFQAAMKAGSLAIEPQTGNLWCLTGHSVGQGKTALVDSAGVLIRTYPVTGSDITYDSHGDAFWIVGEHVLKVNRQGEVLFRTTKAAWNYVSVAPNPQDGSAWVVERNHPDVPGSANRVFLFDDKGRELRKVELEGRIPFGVACDAKTGTAWVVILRKGILRVPVKGEPLPLLDFPAVSIAIGSESGQVWIGTETEVLRLDKDGKVVVRYPLGRASGQSWLSAR
jgi:hypothetical protein